MQRFLDYCWFSFAYSALLENYQIDSVCEVARVWPGRGLEAIQTQCVH